MENQINNIINGYQELCEIKNPPLELIICLEEIKECISNLKRGKGRTEDIRFLLIKFTKLRINKVVPYETTTLILESILTLMN